MLNTDLGDLSDLIRNFSKTAVGFSIKPGQVQCCLKSKNVLNAVCSRLPRLLLLATNGWIVPRASIIAHTVASRGLRCRVAIAQATAIALASYVGPL